MDLKPTAGRSRREMLLPSFGTLYGICGYSYRRWSPRVNRKEIDMRKLVLAAVAMALAVPGTGWSATMHKSNGPHREAVVQEPRQRLGTLTCEVAGGMGMVIGSNRVVSCRFRQQSGRVEKYSGSIGKLGLDVGISGRSHLSWIVINTKPTRVGEGDLAGTYVGASANASLGIGVGANALVGGNSRNFALQPVSGQTGSGLNVAAGVSRLQLSATR